MLRAGSSSGVELFQVLRQFHSATISLSPEYLSFDRFTVHRRPNLTLFPIIHPRHPLSPPQPTLFNDISLSPPQPALFGEVRTLPIFQNFPSKSQSFSWLICRKNIRTMPILQLFSSDFLSCNMAYLALHFNLLRAARNSRTFTTRNSRTFNNVDETFNNIQSHIHITTL